MKGFTLLEVLIAITLLSFSMISVISITSTSTDTRDTVIGEDNKYLQTETSLSVMDWDFSHIYSPRYFTTSFGTQTPGANGAITPQQNPQQQFTGDAYAYLMRPFQSNPNFVEPASNFMPIPRFESPEKGFFKFLTASHRRVRAGEKTSVFAWVIYRLENGKLMRYYYPNDPFGAKEWRSQKTKAQVLLENVTSFNIQYWDWVSQQYQDSVNLVREGNKVLRGIKVTLEVKEEESEDIPPRKVIRVYRPLWPVHLQIQQTQSATQATTTPVNSFPGGTN